MSLPKLGSESRSITIQIKFDLFYNQSVSERPSNKQTYYSKETNDSR